MIALEFKKILKTEKSDFYSNNDSNKLFVNVQLQAIFDTLMKTQKFGNVETASEDKIPISNGVIKQVILECAKDYLLSDPMAELNI